MTVSVDVSVDASVAESLVDCFCGILSGSCLCGCFVATSEVISVAASLSLAKDTKYQ